MNVGVPLIVIVVFLVIWVVTNVVRAQQEDAKGYKRNTTQPPRPSASGRIEQNSGNDIERFLAEIDRLRKKPGGAENPRPGDPRPAAAALAASKLQPKPKQQKARKPQQRRVESETPSPPKPAAGSLAAREFAPSQPAMPSMPAPPPLPTQPHAPTSIEAVRRVSAPTKPSDVLAASLPPLPATPAMGVSAAILGKKTARESASPALRSLEDLLKSTQGPAIAVLMQEILGKPKSQRKE